VTETIKRPWPPFYYELDGGVFHPSGLTRSPWDRKAIAGGPVSALLASAAEDPALDDMEIARFTVDIFGKVPYAPLTLHSQAFRDGRQTKLHRIVMMAGEREVAQAHVLRVRRIETPVHPAPHDYPAPDACKDVAAPHSARMAGAVRMRRVNGGPGAPGRGVAWLALDGEIVRGRTPSPFVKATMFADYGNGFGSATHASEWSFANLDITVQFLRMPVGEWLLLDAETHMAGNGHGTARSVFADAQGVYARGFQTIFVAPGHLSPSLPRIPSELA
jgi:acyl-CoA thioesterase